MQLIPQISNKHLDIPGDIQELGMVGLFKLLESAASSGRLRLASEGRKASVWMRGSKVVYIRTPAAESLLRYLLVHNRFLSESIYRRCWQRFLTAIKRQEQRRGCGHFLDYLRASDLLTQQHRDELHRLLVEWQALSLLAWRRGRFVFDRRDIPERYSGYPGISPERLVWRFEQLLDATTPLSDVYPWERGIDLDYGRLTDIPLPILLNVLKQTKASGVLTLKRWLRTLKIPCDQGRITLPVTQWVPWLGQQAGKYYFQSRQAVADLAADSDRGSWQERVFDYFFEAATFPRVLERRHKRDKIKERSEIRETSSMLAWISVRAEDFWQTYRPSLQWFLPLFGTLLIPLFLFALLNRLDGGKVTYLQTGSSTIHSKASELLRRFAERSLVLPKDKPYQFSDAEYAVQVNREPKNDMNDSLAYLFSIEQNSAKRKQRLSLKLIDIQPTQAQGHFLIRSVKQSKP